MLDPHDHPSTPRRRLCRLLCSIANRPIEAIMLVGCMDEVSHKLVKMHCLSNPVMVRHITRTWQQMSNPTSMQRCESTVMLKIYNMLILTA